MATLTKKQKATISNLMIAYSAWNEFRGKLFDDPLNTELRQNLKVWSRILDGLQRNLSLFHVNVDTLEANMAGFLYGYIDSFGKLRYTDDKFLATL